MCAMSSSLTHWGLSKMTTLCVIFVNKLPDSKFQIELTNENCCSSASYSESCSYWKNIIGWLMAWYRRGDKPLPEPKMTKVCFPVGVALDVSGSPYRNSIGLPAISRADSTGRSHRMPYGAARPKRVNACPPWALLHAIITYPGSISTLHTWEIVCKYCANLICHCYYMRIRD